MLWIHSYSACHLKDLIFNPSPIEAAIYHKNQIVMVHDIIPLLFPQYHKKQYFYFKYILPIILEKSAKILTVSYKSKEDIIEYYNIDERKIRVIYNGVSNLFLQNNCIYQNQENYILYVGRNSPTKNIQNLLKAFERLVELYHIDIRLKLVCERKDLQLHLSKFVQNRIEFLGNVSDIRLKTLYHRACLLVQPSLYEGFGLTPLEAMACGCPTVVSNVASLPEICGNAAYYVAPHDVGSIADGLYRVVTDVDLRGQLISRGLERARLFSWEKSAQEHIKMFHEVAGDESTA